MTATLVKPQPEPTPVDIDAFIDPSQPASWSRQMVSLLQAGHYREGYEVLAEHMPFVDNMLRPYAECLAGQENSWTQLHAAMTRFLDHSVPMKVLDVGCAIGCHAIELARKGHEAWGIDVLPAMINRGRELADSLNLDQRVHLLEGDIRRLEDYFEPRFFDAVVACDIFEHLDDTAIAETLAGLRQVMKPGATLVIQTSPAKHYYFFEPTRKKLLAMLVPFAWLPDRLFGLYVDLLERTVLRRQRGEHVRFYRHEYGHINCMHHWHLRRLLEKAGFEQIRTFAEHTHPGTKDEGCTRAGWTKRIFGKKSVAARNVYGVATTPANR